MAEESPDLFLPLYSRVDAAAPCGQSEGEVFLNATRITNQGIDQRVYPVNSQELPYELDVVRYSRDPSIVAITAVRACLNGHGMGDVVRANERLATFVFLDGPADEFEAPVPTVIDPTKGKIVSRLGSEGIAKVVQPRGYKGQYIVVDDRTTKVYPGAPSILPRAKGVENQD